MGMGPEGRERLEGLVAERLEMGALLVTAERVVLESDEARHLARWLVHDLALAGVHMEYLDYR